MREKFYYVFMTILAAWSLIFFASCGAPAAPPTENAARETVPIADLIRQADELFAERADLAKLREAIKLLKRARRSEERNFEAAWKLAQFNYFLGKDATDEKESERAFAECLATGAVAARIAPDRPDGYFWQAACYGGEAERSPFTKGITAVEKIRELMRKVIQIEPGFQGAMAYDALAIIELKTAFYGGAPAKAVELLNQGLTLNPENFLMRFHLAEAYFALDQDEQAKKQLELVLKIKPPADLAGEYEKIEKQARRQLDTKF